MIGKHPSLSTLRTPRLWPSTGCLGLIAIACAGNTPTAPNSAGGMTGRSGGATSGDGAAASSGTSPAAAAGAAGLGADGGGINSVGAGGAPPVGGAATSSGGTTDYTAGLPPLGGAAGAAPYDWVGVIGTGQSLSVGQEGNAISTTQPFGNLKLQDDGVDPKYLVVDAPTAKWSVVPLTEPIRKQVTGIAFGGYPSNIWHAGEVYGETPHSGMANMVSSIWQRRNKAAYITAHTVVGEAGQKLTVISKGNNGYAAAIHETRIFKRLAIAAGKTYGVAAIILTHGEADATNTKYGAGVWQLYQDYNADLKQATGQTEDVVLIASQQSSSAGIGNSSVQLYQDSIDHPNKIICAGPKYQYGPYGLHMSGPNYLRVGEKYGEIFDLVVNQKKPWRPVGPKKVARSGAVITIDFDVPTPPLTWDERLVAPHQTQHTAWAKGRGFEVSDSAGKELEISTVELKESSVVLTLTATPLAGAALTLAYAVSQDTTDKATDGYQGGTDLGPHGQLRDSDEMIGPDFEKIEANVTKGSAEITAGSQGGFVRRAPYDVVTGPGLPHDTVAKKLFYDNVTLSSPWPGETGKATLTFNHDLHNYCVHFSVPVL